jgi:hypothetical protein
VLLNSAWTSSYIRFIFGSMKERNIKWSGEVVWWLFG